MKFFAAILLVAIFGQLHSVPLADDDLVDKITKVINEILEKVVGPVGLKDVTVKIPENDVLNGELDIKELTISGLKKLSIETLTFDESTKRLDYTFNFEDIVTVIETDLILSGLIDLDHPLSIKIDLKNLKNEGYAVLADDGKTLDDFNLLATLGESDFDIEGLLNDDKLSEEVSKALTENVAKVINEINPVIAPVVSEIVKLIINIVVKLEN